MKGDWLAILLLVVIGGLLLQAIEAPVIHWIIEVFASWLRALPAPEEHFADMLSRLAWPAAALVIAWWLRDHIQFAAGALARRFEHDNVELGGGFLKMSRHSTTSFATLDGQIATAAAGSTEAENAKIVESLLEYAGDSEANTERLEHWISEQCGATLDPEEFLNEDRFAEHRKRAYGELVKG